jgi:K+-transporting ATPase A subunit
MWLFLPAFLLMLLIMGAMSFLPALALGPIAEHLLMKG